MSTYRLPDAAALADLHDGMDVVGKQGRRDLISWILNAKSELDYYRDLIGKIEKAKNMKEVKGLLQ